VVTVFGDQLRLGTKYDVRFINGQQTVNLRATAISARDLADGVAKAQVRVTVPAMAPGPTKIRVTGGSGKSIDIDEESFTVLQAPISLDEAEGETVATCYRAAVGADGTVYFPLNIGAIAQRMIFSGLGENYPLVFGSDDVVIHNTQGFVMQLLDERAAGIYSITDPGSPNSLELTYDRHEFFTYREQHVHEGGLALDPSDTAWHLDGTPHVDHDHLVVAIHGRLAGGGLPAPGRTAAFDLSIVTVLPDSNGAPTTTRTIQWGSGCSASAAQS
jgi:hypothetical protein